MVLNLGLFIIFPLTLSVNRTILNLGLFILLAISVSHTILSIGIFIILPLGLSVFRFSPLILPSGYFSSVSDWRLNFLVVEKNKPAIVGCVEVGSICGSNCFASSFDRCRIFSSAGLHFSPLFFTAAFDCLLRWIVIGKYQFVCSTFDEEISGGYLLFFRSVDFHRLVDTGINDPYTARFGLGL